MVMSESEIVREYRTAKNKPKQIEVLAELNAVKADWIKDILLRNPESGYVKPGPKPKQTAAAEPEAVREVNALAPEAPGRADRDRGGRRCCSWSWRLCWSAVRALNAWSSCSSRRH